MGKKPQPTCMGMPVPLDHRVDPTSDLTSELDISAVSAPASCLAEPPESTTGAVYLSAGAAIRENALSAAGACCCQGAAAAATAPTTTALLSFVRLVTFRTGMINSRANDYCCIYLPSVQSPAPVSSLAEPPPAASPQLGWWVCQQGLRSARIRGLLLVLAAASAAAAASTTSALPCLFTFGHNSYWYDRNITAVVVTASAGAGFASHCCMPWYE